MSDRFPAEIRIGGKISLTARLLPNDAVDNSTILEGLLSAVEDDGGAWEYGDAPIDPQKVLVQLTKNLGLCLKDGSLCFCDDQAHNGEFEITEEFCVANDIPFDRWSDNYCEYDAENVYFRPGMNSPLCLYSDANGHEVVCGDTVRQALDQLKMYKHHVDICSINATTYLTDAIRILQDACPESPPALEPFLIVD